MNKKKISVIVLVIIIIVVLGIALDYVRFLISDKKEEKSINYENDIQYVTNSLKLIDILETNGIHINEKYKNDLMKYGETILDNYKYISASAEHVCNLYTLSELVNYKNKDRIKDYIDKYYISENRLFNDYELSDSSDVDIDKRIAENCSIMQESYGDDLENEYHISEGLANWYNTKIKTDYSNEEWEDMKWIISCFYYKGKIDLLDIESTRENILKEYDELKNTYNNDDFNNLGEKFYLIKELQLNSDILNLNEDYRKEINDIWRKLDTWEQIDFDNEDSVAPVWLILSLEGVDNIKDNSYFTENINEELLKSYSNIIGEHGE